MRRKSRRIYEPANIIAPQDLSETKNPNNIALLRFAKTIPTLESPVDHIAGIGGEIRTHRRVEPRMNTMLSSYIPIKYFMCFGPISPKDDHKDAQMQTLLSSRKRYNNLLAFLNAAPVTD